MQHVPAVSSLSIAEPRGSLRPEPLPTTRSAPPGAEAREPLARLIGGSSIMRDVRRRIVMMARSTGSVLILGPSGTGKELAASLLHACSLRAAGPFVAIDCGSLSEGVLESELFGHARGAFTGATGDRRGLFEAAHGGTIFLDEIGNTSLALQARLLRVLEQREVRRVGCNVARPVDVRVIAATNRDLSVDVERGAFRADLLYRLDVMTLRMPSLAERPDDIPVMAHALLDDIALAGGSRSRLSAEALACLEAHHWPGNVRELRNALERAVAFADGGVILPSHLPERVAAGSLPAPRMPVVPAVGAGLPELLAAYERRLLLARLASNAWNRTRTARQLGITRRTLFSKMLKHRLADERDEDRLEMG